MNGRLNRYPTKEEIEKLKKADEKFYEKMQWNKQPEKVEGSLTKPLPSLTEEEFLGKLKI